MAAAEYFDPRASMHSLPAQQQQQQQPPPPRQAQPPTNPGPANLNPPYPMSDQPPPPYSYAENNLPRPHSQPPPGQRVPQNQFNAPPFQQYRSNQPDGETHQYPPDKVPQPPRAPSFQNNPRPNEYPAAYPPQQINGPNGYHGYPTPAAPGLSQMYAGQNYPQQRPNSSGNSPHPRPTRSRSRSRERRKHHKQKPELQRQKSKGMNTFLGAGGGAIIGDLIFPGLGTLGGAVLGGIGGHEYGKKRSSSIPGKTYRRSYSSGEEDYRRGRK